MPTVTELELIAERGQKAQADMRARRAAMQRGDWFNPTLMLELKCPECGDSNEYEVRHVAVNPDSKDTDLMLADEFPCASCGHWVDFEFTSGAHLAISAELLKLAADNIGNRPLQPMHRCPQIIHPYPREDRGLAQGIQ